MLGKTPTWLSRDRVDECVPECFKRLYPKKGYYRLHRNMNTASTITCFKPTNVKRQKTHAPKCHFGVSAHVLITLISPLYTGCISDVGVMQLFRILDLLEDGDNVMADKVFILWKRVAENKGVTLKFSVFVCKKKNLH